MRTTRGTLFFLAGLCFRPEIVVSPPSPSVGRGRDSLSRWRGCEVALLFSTLVSSVLSYLSERRTSSTALWYCISRENFHLAAYRQERGGGVTALPHRHNNVAFIKIRVEFRVRDSYCCCGTRTHQVSRRIDRSIDIGKYRR